MALWIVLALMTGAAVLAVLWPLSGTSAAPSSEVGSDVPFYRNQLAEIDRDQARGTLAAAEAEAARIESSRRLLRASAEAPSTVDATSEPALRRRRTASALALSIVPITGLAIYGGLGSPQLPAQPVSARVAAAPTAPTLPKEVASALARIEEHLAANAGDARGWDVLAPIYLRAGRFDDAARAYAQARKSGGDTVERLLGEGEARVSAAEGVVEDDSRALFKRTLELDASMPAARYYLTLAAEQQGDGEAARAGYRALLADAKPDAPWVSLVRSRLARLEGQPSPSAGLPPHSVTPDIAAMVSGLDDRLAANGGSEAEWSRLVRSFVVLGRRDDALHRLAQARDGLKSDTAALERLDRLASELGLRAEVAGR
ncbi:c-type cytochrome biogenesis protein CcmI [uncultured Enterovirga sp.]|uniref:c-type cytochrome biogenesis protein CcmI n=1 Tax=uncultured Enterovirga sp. TaxID=2026352 RepID=UPI0035C94CF4